MKDRSDSFEDALSRWSKRKAEARKSRRGAAAPRAIPADAEPEDVAPVAGAPVAPAAGAAPAPADSEAVAKSEVLAAALAEPGRPLDADEAAALSEELGLPALDDLTAESDYSGFLAKGVPAALTRAALRKLWVSDPVFANLDRLNEYDDDFRAAHAAAGVVQSAYQAGKGYLNAGDGGAEVADAEADTGGDTGADTGGDIGGEAVAETGDETGAPRPDAAPDDTSSDRAGGTPPTEEPDPPTAIEDADSDIRKV